jgi:hypothetical protein
VVVLNRDNPDAVQLGLEEGGLMQGPGVRDAHVAKMDESSFMVHLARLGIQAIRLMAAETNADLDTLEQWVGSWLQALFNEVLHQRHAMNVRLPLVGSESSPVRPRHRHFPTWIRSCRPVAAW